MAYSETRTAESPCLRTGPLSQNESENGASMELSEGLDEMLRGPECGLQAVGYTDLLIDVIDMGLNGVGAYT